MHGRWREAYRHVLDAGYEVGAQPLRLSCQFEVRHSPHYLLDHYPHFEPRQMGADTEVLAMAERQMIIGAAGEVELVCGGEDLFVAVHRRVPDYDLVALANSLAA